MEVDAFERYGADLVIADGEPGPSAADQVAIDANGVNQWDKSSVFDGTEGSKVYTAITFIGRPVEKGHHKTQLKTDGGEQLANVTAWPATISYYDQSQGENTEGLPSYEVSAEMFENGVSGDMIIDYGDYALDAKLSKLQLKPFTECK